MVLWPYFSIYGFSSTQASNISDQYSTYLMSFICSKVPARFQYSLLSQDGTIIRSVINLVCDMESGSSVAQASHN